MKDVANLGGEPLQISVCADAAWLLSKEAFALYAPCLYQPTYESYRERMRGYLADCETQPEGFAWHTAREIAENFPIPTAFRSFTRLLV